MRTNNILTVTKPLEKARKEEDIKKQKMMKREAVRRDIKFACRHSSAHIRNKLQRKMDDS